MIKRSKGVGEARGGGRSRSNSWVFLESRGAGTPWRMGSPALLMIGWDLGKAVLQAANCQNPSLFLQILTKSVYIELGLSKEEGVDEQKKNRKESSLILHLVERAFEAMSEDRPELKKGGAAFETLGK